MVRHAPGCRGVRQKCGDGGLILSIGSQPRFRLAALPTPLQELRNLRQELGGKERSPRILMKRDDLTGLAFGGNKARKLEFLVGDGLRQGATTIGASRAVPAH